MDTRRCRTDKSGESARDLQLLVERGNRLHNQAVFEWMSKMVSAVGQVLRRWWHLTPEDPSLSNLAKNAG